jgi:GT2 family glycosyltransferase
MSDAYRDLLQAVRLNPRDALAHYLLSEVCIRLGAIECAWMYSSYTLRLDPNFKAALAVQIEVSVRRNDLARARLLLSRYPADGEHAPMHALLQQRIAFSAGDIEVSLLDTALLVEGNPALTIARELFAQHFERFMQSEDKGRFTDFTHAVGLHLDPAGADERRVPWSEPDRGSIDIIIPVHNALRDLADCLASIRRWHDPALKRIILVDDASDRVTKAWLDRYAARNADVVLVRNTVNLGFTASVTAGIAQSDAPFFVLLNSDTLLSPGWMTGLWRGLAADSRHAMAGPLSNNAYFQSISPADAPREQTGSDFTRMTERWAAFVRAYGQASYPKVPFLSGFCLMLRRDHYDAAGGLDADTYPRGYWEVQDLALRLIDLGLYPCLVDDTYVHHSRSGSIEAERRDKLVSDGFRRICARHGAIRVLAAEEICRHLPEVLRQTHGLSRFFEPPPAAPVTAGPVRSLPARRWAVPLPEGAVTPDADLCLFVAHAPHGQLPDLTAHYLQELRQSGLKVVVCLAVDDVATTICDGWARRADAVVLRENVGLDFGAWADLLRWRPDLWSARRLIFANDSVTGPFRPLSGMFERLRHRDAGFFALTDCTIHQYHAQSYFFGWSQRNLAAQALRAFWRDVENYRDKDQVIRKYEIPLLSLSDALPDPSHQILFGMQDIFGRFAGTLPQFSPAHHAWQALFESGNPFVKTAVLREDARAIDVLSALTGADPALLRRHVEQSNLNRL